MAGVIVGKAKDPLEEQEPIPAEPLPQTYRSHTSLQEQAKHGPTGASEVQVNPQDADENELDWSEDSDEELLEAHILHGEDSKYVYETGIDICTPEESVAYRELLHKVGVEDFVLETITKNKVRAKKLVTAFGIRPPPFLEGQPDHAYYKLLGIAISRELSKRRRLVDYSTIDDVAELLKTAKNVIVITGAGISTSLGIPDFRSKHTGFYAKLCEAGWQSPEDVFDIHNFDDDPKHFYNLAGDILPDTKKWTPTHEFIRLLQDKGKLLRNYTQNIDNVEANAGILPEKLVQCHGSWATATCRKCSYQELGGEGSEMFQHVKRKEVYSCKKCTQTFLQAPSRPGMKRKRSGEGHKPRKKKYEDDDTDSGGEFDIPEPGVMKPDITFFGEQLPNDFFDKIRDEDRFKVDLVIVIGTSMKVAPVSEIPAFLPEKTPQVYISRDEIFHIDFDVNLLGYCDVVVAELCKRAGWELTHDMIPPGRRMDVITTEDNTWTHRVEEIQ